MKNMINFELHMFSKIQVSMSSSLIYQHNNFSHEKHDKF